MKNAVIIYIVLCVLMFIGGFAVTLHNSIGAIGAAL